MSRVARWVVGVGSMLALAACEVAEPDAVPAGGDSAGADTKGADVLETSAPAPASDESVVSLGGSVGEARDDLFPDLSGDELVWLRVWLDMSMGGAVAETDCLACPYCTGCRFDVMHRTLPDGEVELLYEGHAPRSSPRVGDGLVCWLEDGGGLTVRELATRAQRQVTTPSWIQATPLPKDGQLWWWGWDSWSSTYGFMRHDVASQVTEMAFATYVQDPHWSPSSQLSQLAQRQPFAIDAQRIVWVQWDATQVVKEWAFGGAAETVATDPEQLPVRALLLGRDEPGVDRLVVMSQPAGVGCQPSECELEFTAVDGAGATALAVDAEPSRYVPPVADGARLVWLDRRDGLYEVWGLDDDGEALRLSSDEAMIGAVSPLAASNGRVVWADRRSGRFRLMARTW